MWLPFLGENASPTARPSNTQAWATTAGQYIDAAFRVLYGRQELDQTTKVALLCVSPVLLWHIRRRTRHFATAEHIPPHYIDRAHTLTGKVMHVGDGDNFRLLHSAGWPGFWWRRRPWGKGDLGRKTISVRLAGIDAPEVRLIRSPSFATRRANAEMANRRVTLAKQANRTPPKQKSG